MTWERQRPKDSIHKMSFDFCLFMRNFVFTGSSAIVDNGITVTDNRANIVFKGNREYVYEITDPASFEMQLEGEIADQNGSVGRFVNTALKNELLKPITV